MIVIFSINVKKEVRSNAVEYSDGKQVKDSPVSPGFEPPSKRQKPGFHIGDHHQNRPIGIL